MKDTNPTKEEAYKLFKEANSAKSRDVFSDKSNRALKMAQSIGDKLLEARILSGMACGAVLEGEFKQFRTTALVVLNIFEETDDPKNEIFEIEKWAKCFAMVGNYSEANIWYQRALEVAKICKDFDAIVSVLSGLGDLLQKIPVATRDEQLDNLRKSNEYYLEALRVIDENQLSSNDKAIMLNRTGCTYMNLGNKTLALREFNLAMEIAQKLESNSLIETVRDNLQTLEEGFESHAVVTVGSEEMENAIDIDEESAEALTNAEGPYNLRRAEELLFLGTYWEQKGSFDKAKECFDKSIKICRKEESDYDLLGVLMNLSGLLSESMNNYDEAEKVTLEALDLARNIPNQEIQEGLALLRLSRIAEINGETEKAQLYSQQIPPEAWREFQRLSN